MKHLKSFNESIEPNPDEEIPNEKPSGPSMEDLQKFYKRFMEELREHSKLDKDFNFIDKNKSIIEEALNLFLFTPQLRAGVFERYKVDVPQRTYLVKRGGTGSPWNKETHHHKRWEIADREFGDRRFIVSLEIEIPKWKQFQADNTVITLDLNIKPNNRRKEFYEMYNVVISPNDSDGNFTKLFDVIQKFGEAMNEIFKPQMKLSNKKF